jgi:hypothetical protein
MKISIPVLILVFISPFVSGQPYTVKEYGYTLDPPQDWESVDAGDLSKLTFTNPGRTAFFRILSFPGSRYSGVEDMFQETRYSLEATGEGSVFSYAGTDAFLADLSFQSISGPVRGYLVFIDGSRQDYILQAYAVQERYEQQHDFLLSCLDSFSLEQTRLLPGPISQFYYPFPGPVPVNRIIRVGRQSVSVAIDSEEFDAAQVLIEREARVLATYKQNQIPAWRRYYRMIYRDTYHRLDHAAAAVRPMVEGGGGAGSADTAAALLQWIQGFSYSRTGTLSDLLSPLIAVYRNKGDCDSRALLYIIFLHQMGVDAILLVSARFSHSLVGVDILGKGARYSYEKKNYLLAELTERVDIGLIPQDMADPSGWIPVALGPF